MRSTENICFIVNPRAADGAAGKSIPKIQAAAERVFANHTVKLTTHPKHATSLAAEVAQDNFDVIAAVGGDGTCHEIINGLIKDDKPINPKLTFAVIPFGTGSDLIKSLLTPSKIVEAVETAAFGETRFTDVGKALVSTEHGKSCRYFINVAGFGANGEVVRRANTGSKRFGGRLTFLKATLETSFTYRSPKAKLTWAAPQSTPPKIRHWEDRILSCFLANGSYCGGGMWVAPKGSMNDGLLDVTVLAQKTVASQLVELRLLYNGEISSVEGASCFRAETILAEPAMGEIIRIDLDGELSGMLPAEFSLLPQIIPIRAKWISS